MAEEGFQEYQSGSDDADIQRDSQEKPVPVPSGDIVPKKFTSDDQSLEKIGSSTQRFGYESGSRLDIARERSEDLRRRSKTDKYSSKAKIALGSTIDIRRASLGGDVSDRKTARYMNTYKLDSDNPFNPEKVDKILESVMVEALENLTYDPEKCPKQAKWASMAIRAKVKELEFDRYKIICIVTIGEKNSQDVFATCRFLWDTEKDRYSVFLWKIPTYSESHNVLDYIMNKLIEDIIFCVYFHPKYKIICIVTIGEKNSQDVFATCRFLWDTEKDRYSVFSLENTYVFGIAQCFGLYYE